MVRRKVPSSLWFTRSGDFVVLICKLFEEFSLIGGDPFRCVNDDANKLIALAAVKMPYALFVDAVDGTRLGTGLNLYLLIPVEGRNLYWAAKCSKCKGYGNLDHDIVADPAEQVMGLFFKFDYDVTAPTRTPMSLVPHAHVVACGYPGRDVYLYLMGFLDPAGTTALLAGFSESLACPAASRAGLALLERTEEGAGNGNHLSPALAGGAGLRVVSALAHARLAAIVAGDLNLLVNTFRDLF